MAKKIELLDKIMGSGKSTAVLDWCEKNPETPFMYVTPLLSESEQRVVDACVVSKFIAPVRDSNKTKSEHLLDLLCSGVNVSITHELYGMLSDKHLQAIKQNKYTVILDEEVSFIEPVTEYSVEDFKYLRSLNQIKAEEDGKLLWMNNDDICFNTKYSKLMSMCRLGMIYQSKRSEDWFVTQLPIDLVLCAERVILITYLFKGSVMDSFLKIKGISVEDFTEVEVKETDKKIIRDLIEFVGKPQCEKWSGESLSSSWYKSANQKTLTDLANSIRAIGVTNKAKGSDLLWCTPSSVARPRTSVSKKVNPKGYSAGKGDVVNGIASGSFLPCSSRATNNYRDRSVMVHCYNRFPHVTVSCFLEDYGAAVDSNQFALSELLQWIWRSRIRQGEPIKLCILSKRMRKIFQEWLYMG